jgi:hypothetical protein
MAHVVIVGGMMALAAAFVMGVVVKPRIGAAALE